MKIRNDLIKDMRIVGGFTIKQAVDLEQSWKEFTKRNAAVRRILNRENQTQSRRLKLRFEILERDGFRCRYCGRSVAQGATLQIDHINPRSKGGQDTSQNYLTACSDCNIGKSDALLEPIRLWQLQQQLKIL